LTLKTVPPSVLQPSDAVPYRMLPDNNKPLGLAPSVLV
jgi:hypothetical protein